MKIARLFIGHSFLVLLLTGCCSQHLSVRNQYIDHDYLASTHVDTPDPRRCGVYCGQQLIIRWKFPPSILECPDLHLLLYLRFRNLEIRCVEIPLTKSRGTYVYRILNQEYFDTDGILTYKLEVRSGQEVVERWTHQVWTRLIDLSSDEIYEEELDEL